VERTVEGMAAGGGIAIDAMEAGVRMSMLPLGATELRGSAATDDCRDTLPVVDRPLGVATGLNTGPPFSVVES
jgi:hypothetical protein